MKLVHLFKKKNKDFIQSFLQKFVYSYLQWFLKNSRLIFFQNFLKIIIRKNLHGLFQKFFHDCVKYSLPPAILSATRQKMPFKTSLDIFFWNFSRDSFQKLLRNSVVDFSENSSSTHSSGISSDVFHAICIHIPWGFLRGFFQIKI